MQGKIHLILFFRIGYLRIEWTGWDIYYTITLSSTRSLFLGSLKVKSSQYLSLASHSVHNRLAMPQTQTSDALLSIFIELQKYDKTFFVLGGKKCSSVGLRNCISVIRFR